jgi:hypothetical protein
LAGWPLVFGSATLAEATWANGWPRVAFGGEVGSFDAIQHLPRTLANCGVDVRPLASLLAATDRVGQSLEACAANANVGRVLAEIAFVFRISRAPDLGKRDSSATATNVTPIAFRCDLVS